MSARRPARCGSLVWRRRPTRRRGHRRGRVIDARRREAVGRWAPVVGWCLLLTAVLLRPIAHSGYLLGHDMVFTPRQPLGADAVGLGSAAPRAVPLDALVALAERIVDGAVVGRVAVVGPLLAAGLGTAALVGRERTAVRLVAGTAAIWNPYVVERLALGQWALLWAYAALPWLVLAVIRGRGRGGWAGRAMALAAASITPTGGVVATAATVALVTSARRPRRELLATIGLALVVQLPWIVPALVSTASGTSDPAGVAAFSAWAEHPGGVLLSLLGGGGIWDADVVPGSRGGALPWLWLAILALATAYGARRLVELIGAPTVRALAITALGGLFIAWLPALPGGDRLVRAAVEHLPGAGLLRDAQKWILPLVLLEALLCAAALARLLDRLAAVTWRLPAAVAATVLPLIVLPDAAATLRAPFTPVHYPRDWSAVARYVRAGGDVAVLPWGSYRRFPWARASSVLDPAPRLLPAPTVVDDRLAVSGRLLAGESTRSADVLRALSARDLAAALARAGIRWIVVEHRTPGSVPDLTALDARYRGRDVSLYRVPGRVTAVRPSAGRVAAVAVGDILAIGALLGPIGWWLAGRVRRRTRPKTPRGSTAPLL